ncbi:ComF family protein [Algoriphagus halophytocola]|nr:ComF family protein [Algoriphagus sp. TR-M9]WBL42764.1 ComF family protein [Algoriphagus sp. TR-M9]
MRLFFVKDFLDLVFPRNCALCGRSLFDYEECLCMVCSGSLPITSYHLRSSDNDLKDKVLGLSNVGMVMSFLKFSKGGQSQKLLHKLKYRNMPELGVELGKKYGEILYKSGFEHSWDKITPVPLHPLKKARRGYNQSEEFAKGLNQKLPAAISKDLQRVKFTETQTQKSRLERMDNVETVFALTPEADVSGARVLLVDDVMTTGATMCACANVLLANGAKTVDLVAIAAGD